MVQLNTEVSEAPIGHPTTEQVAALADAMWQILDDMGDKSQSTCLGAKAQARIAYEPFRDKSEPEYDDWLSFEDAKMIIDEAEHGRRGIGTAG